MKERARAKLNTLSYFFIRAVHPSEDPEKQIERSENRNKTEERKMVERRGSYASVCVYVYVFYDDLEREKMR